MNSIPLTLLALLTMMKQAYMVSHHYMSFRYLKKKKVAKAKHIFK